MNDRMINFYMALTQTCADMSRAIKLKVGCVIVKNDNIISFSWNGTPAGWSNDCENDNGKTKDEVIHAEANAILKLAKSGDGGDGADLFCTHAPCVQCAKLIYGAGIKKVFYRDTYRDTLGIEFLEKCNIEVERINA